MNNVTPIRNSVYFGSSINRQLFEKTIYKLETNKNIIEGINFSEIIHSLEENLPNDVKFSKGSLALGGKSIGKTIKKYVLYLFSESPFSNSNKSTFTDAIKVTIEDNQSNLKILEAHRSIEVGNRTNYNPFDDTAIIPEQQSKEHVIDILNKTFEKINS